MDFSQGTHGAWLHGDDTHAMIASRRVAPKEAAVVAVLKLEATYGLQFKLALGRAGVAAPRAPRRSQHRRRPAPRSSGSTISSKSTKATLGPSDVAAMYAGLE